MFYVLPCTVLHECRSLGIVTVHLEYFKRNVRYRTIIIMSSRHTPRTTYFGLRMCVCVCNVERWMVFIRLARFLDTITRYYETFFVAANAYEFS